MHACEWFSIGRMTDVVLTHNLGTTELFVYMIGKDSSGNLHQYAYGSYRWYGEEAQRDRGVFWTELTDTTIEIHRCYDDDFDQLRWDQARVMIWKIEAQPQGVGGFWVPVDKFSLLAPYIISAITIILVASISVAYLKYRKRQ